jgi:hypothetical protein
VFALDSDLGIGADAEIKPDFAEASFEFGKTLQTADGAIKTAAVCRMPDAIHGTVTLIDYASAGKNWKSDIAAWLKYNRV